jgi:hypothetical protein
MKSEILVFCSHMKYDGHLTLKTSAVNDNCNAVEFSGLNG